jgi:hypothetical protein
MKATEISDISMNVVSAFVSQYGKVVLFAMVFAEEIGLPLPAVPVLLSAGALAGAGKMDLAGAIILSVMACMVGDLIWYELGPGADGLWCCCIVRALEEGGKGIDGDWEDRRGFLIGGNFNQGLQVTEL